MAACTRDAEAHNTNDFDEINSTLVENVERVRREQRVDEGDPSFVLEDWKADKTEGAD